MPPRKKQAGIATLIGKTITLESRYDNVPVTGILRSADVDYLGIEIAERVFYFSKDIVRMFTETMVTNEPS